MAIDGTWNVRMDTPMGERTSTLEAKAQGGALTGTQAAEGNSGDIFDGTVMGNTVAWKISISSPMPMTLEFNGTLEGDTISGMMKAGGFGSWPFSATRA